MKTRYYYDNKNNVVINEYEAKEIRDNNNLKEILWDNLPKEFPAHMLDIKSMADRLAKATAKTAWFVNSDEAPELNEDENIELYKQRISATYIKDGYIAALNRTYPEEYIDAVEEMFSIMYKAQLDYYKTFKNFVL